MSAVAQHAEPGSVDGLVAELERILEVADRGLTALQTGEAPRGTCTLAKIKNMARDAIRWADRDGGEECRGDTGRAS